MIGKDAAVAGQVAVRALMFGGSGQIGRAVAMEQALHAAKTPVSILRPAMVHGIGARHPRQWWFVKRALDRRAVIPRVAGGTTVCHTSPTIGMGSLACHCLARRLAGTFNAGDPIARSVGKIAGLIGACMNHPFTLVGVGALFDAAGDAALASSATNP